MENVFYSKYSKICGIYASDDGKIYIARVDENNLRVCNCIPFKPYAWTSQDALVDDFEDLNVPSNVSINLPLNRLVRFPSTLEFEKYMRTRNKALPFFRLVSVESQFLSEFNLHMFSDMRFDD
ncbi:MAG: hypothetical protein J6B07_01340, partial [Opitutales bacterium]|nr:hypothetical protein [Opitutales bacterium]